jgi:hypothetical protein
MRPLTAVTQHVIQGHPDRKEPFVRLLTALTIVLALSLADAGSAVQAAPESKGPKPPSRNITGTVRSSSQDVVVVAGRENGKEGEWTFPVEPTTTIRKGTKAIVAADLKPGDGVQVRFVERNGKPHVESIRVIVARKESAKK